MKSLPNPFFLFILLVGFIATSRGSAQTFTPLRSFSATPNSGPYTNADGALLNAPLLVSGNRLYGTTKNGGTSGNGTVFALNTDGTAFSNLHNFAATSGGSIPNTVNLDGANPQADLVLLGNTLYGTAPFGGTNGDGTVFAVNIDGTGFTILHTFTSTSGSLLTNTDGASPFGGLVLSGNTLFGTTENGGSYGDGTIFAVSTDGASFTNLHSFHGSDGSHPFAGMILSGNTLYGTTGNGGSFDYGTVFSVNTDSTTFTNLHSFNKSDGVNPFAGLISSSNKLYGMTQTAGPLGYGTIFALNTDGTTFTNLHSFNKSDGCYPQARLILSGNTLYGTATYGGNFGNGTVFAVNTDGTGFVVLHIFTATTGSQGGYGVNSDGGYPVGGLILSSNTLFGTAHMGGKSGSGTVFSLSLQFGPIYADFTTPTIRTNNMTLTPGAYFTYNTTVGGSWGIAAESFGFLGTFVVPANGSYRLTVDHQTSAASTCPGGGYSPVDIYVNGTQIASNFDPAQQNGGSLAEVTNSWVVNALAGENSFQWVAGALCSRYWIQGIQVTPAPSAVLTIIHYGADFILSWPTSGVTLQSTTNLDSPLWTTNSPPPVVVNGHYTVTNPISGMQRFFRLSR